MADYPECEKLLKISAERNAQEALLEWLGEHGYTIAQERCPHGRLPEDMVNCPESEYCRTGQQETGLWPVIVRHEDLLMEFHGIDMRKVEQERQAMLKAFSEGP